jgi:hypothetical protein
MEDDDIWIDCNSALNYNEKNRFFILLVPLFVSFLFPLHLSDSVLEFAAATGECDGSM